MHDVGLQTSLVRLPAVTAICMKRDLPNRQFTQDMLRINVEKDYAIHSIQRQEAIFRRRYCHLISRVENLGRHDAHQDKGPPIVALRRKSDPGPRRPSNVSNAHRMVCSAKPRRRVNNNSYATQRLSPASLPDLRHPLSTTQGENDMESELSQRRKSKTKKEKSSMKKCSDDAEKSSVNDRRVSIREALLSDSPPADSLCERADGSVGVTNPTTDVRHSDETEAGEKVPDSSKERNGKQSESSGSEAAEKTEDNRSADPEEVSSAPVDDEEGTTGETQTREPHPCRREDFWSKAYSKVFVDYGPTTIDKIFNALFDPEVDDTVKPVLEESAVSEVGNRRENDRQREDSGIGRKVSLKPDHFYSTLHGLRQAEARRQKQLERSKGRDNSVDSLKKCRYLRLPARRFREQINATDQKVNIWRL